MQKRIFCFIFSVFSMAYVLAGWAVPKNIDPLGEKVIVVDPLEHTWAAYDPNGNLVKSGLASAGANWCKDIKRVCHTRTGFFRIHSLGSRNCVSPSFPLPKGGAPMQYCMYFNETQALHGHPNVVAGNISHGCVRVKIHDAKWLRYNFAEYNTLVYVHPYTY